MDRAPTVDSSLESVAHDPEELIDVHLLLGRMFFLAGASAQRVIGSIARLDRILGGEETHVLVCYDAIVVTCRRGDIAITRMDQTPTFRV